jgi:two-component system, HptB-dependent secretion and biofilm response regulator
LSDMKVLIVDDHQYNRNLLAFILEDFGYQSSFACDGQEAVDAVTADPSIGMVLMDVNMPVMDGREATRIIKETITDRFVPIVFVTALDEDQALSECLSSGGDDFISKPVNESVLIAKIAAHMRTAKLYQELQVTNKSLSYHQRVMDREHAIVEHVFQNGMQRIDLQCENLKYRISPMSMFNGDVVLAAPSPSGGLYVLLGDFTGHGLSAAIGCLPVADAFYAMANKQASVADMATEINHKLQSLLPSNMFFCAAILELSLNGDRLSYWVGGINDLLLLAPDGGVVERLQAQHMPLGVLDEGEFDAAVDVVNPAPGTRLIVYTDGIIESQNEQGEMFGEERLEALLSEPVDSYIDLIAETVTHFREGGEQTDDMSLVELECGPVIHNDGLPVREEADNAIALPWKLSFHLTALELGKKDLVADIIRLLGGNLTLRSHLDILFTVLSELFSNALEHGLLQLDSSLKESPDGFEEYYRQRQQRIVDLAEGTVDVSLALTGTTSNKLQIKVTDSGSGFDFESLQQQNAEESSDFSFGRGIELIHTLCDSLEYTDGGRTVTAIYRLD